MRNSLVLLLAALCLWAAPAQAHKMSVFATAQGDKIEGYVYFSGGVRPEGVPVTVTVDGTTVDHLTTGPGGTFHFRADHQADHLITTESEGHMGQWTVRASELPASLSSAPNAAPPPAADPAPEPVTASETPPKGEELAAVEAMVERAVARQVAPLREEIQQWRNEVRWRDVAGGLGWIIGLAGLAAWTTGRRRKL